MSGETRSPSFWKTRETVERETPAARATSSMVGCRGMAAPPVPDASGCCTSAPVRVASAAGPGQDSPAAKVLRTAQVTCR
ncbi:hypothetical protein BCONGLO52_06120 [Brachybacterium conglomeratum]|uniref:Uncharacterized protein n=1 Tax=Brachybacterium conglomeratum TaxID=47846 RepID=A0ABQ5REG6_9MICO|nr:hypothetical protein BCONGLO52_06120 [Brachybacterium conglomeratum]GLK05360.1 hypothetical protein GCM10017597_21600 [Brachybacterium conglomeratum]